MSLEQIRRQKIRRLPHNAAGVFLHRAVLTDRDDLIISKLRWRIIAICFACRRSSTLTRRRLIRQFVADDGGVGQLEEDFRYIAGLFVAIICIVNVLGQYIWKAGDVLGRWDCLEEDIAGSNLSKTGAKNGSKESLQLWPHSFDTIVGTDVVFTPTLVRPLLACLALMAHKHTNIYLCLQVRCADSHDLLLEKASKFGLKVKDCSHKAFMEECSSTCSWGIDMECKLLHITVKKTKKDSVLLKKGQAGDSKKTKRDEKKARKRKEMETNQVNEPKKGRKKRRKLS